MTFVKTNVLWVLAASLIVPSVVWATDGASPQVQSDHRSKDVRITTEADAIDLSGREVGISVSGVKTSKGTKATRVKAHIKAPLFVNGDYAPKSEAGFKLFEGASVEVDHNGSKVQSHKIQVQGPAAFQVKGFNRNFNLGSTLGLSLTPERFHQLRLAHFSHVDALRFFLEHDRNRKKLRERCNLSGDVDTCNEYEAQNDRWQASKETLEQAKTELKTVARSMGLKIDPEKYKTDPNAVDEVITEAGQALRQIPHSIRADSTAQFTVLQLGFKAEKDPEAGLQQTVGTLDLLNMGGHTAFKIGGLPMHTGGNISGGGFVGKSKFARETHYSGAQAGAQAEGRAFVGVRAPKLGEINYGGDLGWQYDRTRSDRHLLKAGHEISIESAPIGGAVRAGVVGRKETTRSYSDGTLADKKDATVVGVSVRGAFE